MAIADWTELETIDGIVEGRISPEAMPFAELSPEDQRYIIDEIDAAVAAIEVPVIRRYPDLKSEAQRCERLREYKREFLSRVEDHLREVYGSYFDTLHGCLIRSGRAARSYTIDDSGVVEFAT